MTINSLLRRSFCHYLVHYDGKFYDSNLGVLEEYDMSKLLGYLEIKC